MTVEKEFVLQGVRITNIRFGPIPKTGEIVWIEIYQYEGLESKLLYSTSEM